MAEKKTGVIAKVLDRLEGPYVKAAGALGGPEAAAHEKEVFALARQGHYVDETVKGLQVDGDIIAHGISKYVDAGKPIAVEIAGALGGPKAAALQAQTAEDLRHGHLIDEWKHGMQAGWEETKNIARAALTSHSAPEFAANLAIGAVTGGEHVEGHGGNPTTPVGPKPAPKPLPPK